MIKFKNILCCPSCKSSLSLKNDLFSCNKCKKTFLLKNGIPFFVDSYKKEDLKLSSKKWNSFYDDFFSNLNDKTIKIEIKDAQKTISQINKFCSQKKGDFFLELGCGPAFYCQEYIKKGMNVVGIDFSFTALRGAEKLFKKSKLLNFLLVGGDVCKMPFKDNSFDLIYGGGVIEHFKDTKSAIKEIHRVLKPDGIVFNTVPLLNIGSLTYRQVWGNIPNLPVLKELAEIIHVKILKSRYMTFGWEYSFTRSYLRKIHKEVGFKEVIINKFEVDLEFAFIRNKQFKKVANFLAQKSPLFWPMVYIVAKK